MKLWIVRSLVLVLLVLTANAAFAGAAAETAGQILAKLSKLSPDQRQKTLIEKARAEGEVSFYSSLQAQQIDPFIRVFQKRYPFIRVNPYRVSGNRQVIKIQTEMNAGNHLFDVTNGAAEQASALKKIGAIDPYHSPQRDFFTEPNKDKEGFFTSLYVIPIVLGYNINLVKRQEIPKSYDDLLQPRWKSNMFLDDEAYEWFAVLLKHYGREKGLQYMRNLAKQDLRLLRGRTQQSQLIAAGERPLAIVLSGHTVLDLKARGAPVDQVILDPYFAQANKLMLARHAPHPHAAALFMDWSLSEEGQSMITTFGRVVARKGVKQRFPELVEKESLLVDVDFIGPILDQSGKEFSQILLGR
ncbi:MAG TPA: extracellular solute-binding protein [Candidatus Binatia bacterium]|nr:extracellular solute-binding protein [Candidatus Binatia bacterium]